MNIVSEKITVRTKKEGDIIDLTSSIEEILSSIKLQDGIVTVFCTHSTGAISTIEYEPGLLKDVPEALERIAPKSIDYAHHQTWHDDNGRSHVKATLLGPSLTVPFIHGKLTLGTWQQIIFIELDTQGRDRQIILQFLGS